MLGSSYRFERTAAGESGPRGCAPLARPFPSRIARAVPNWKAPVTKQFTLTATGQLIAARNPNRALLVFCIDVPAGSQPAGQAAICATQADCAATVPLAIFGLWYAAGGKAKLTFTLSYEQHGALTINEWWAVDTAANGTRLNVLEQEFLG